MRLVTALCLAAAMLLAPLIAGAPAFAASAKKPEHKVTQSKTYLSVQPIYTTIVDSDKAVGLLMVGIGIDVPDDSLRQEADLAMPVLRDAYVRSLAAFAATAVRVTRQPDVDRIAARLQAATDHALRRKGARVLLAQVALRVTK